MTKRARAIVGAALAAVIVNFFGVFFFFRPIAESDSVGGWVPPPIVGFLVYISLSVVLLDRSIQHFGQPIKVGMVIALSQILLIADLVLRGDRGLATGVAGAMLALVTWSAMSFVYSRARPHDDSEVGQAAQGV